MQENTLISKTLIISPGGALQGEVDGGLALPGDKSLSHRAALFAALARGDSRIENFLVSGVTQAMLSALTSLEVPWILEGTTLTVRGAGLEDGRDLPQAQINCGNSATTMRLLAGALAAWNRPVVLDGSAGLRRRPMGRIVDPLQAMGVDIQAAGGCAPLTIRPVDLPLRTLDYELPVASAQVKSCLLLAALAAGEETRLREPGPSRDHTERMLASMGLAVQGLGAPDYITRLSPQGAAALDPLEMRLPGDISAAAFLIVAVLITPGSSVTLRGVGLNPTRTGLLDALMQMGAQIEIHNQNEQAGEPVGDLIVRHSQLSGIQVDGSLVVRMIDEFPIFAVAAAYAAGETLVSDAVELRHKESDRITALCSELKAVGADIEEHPDGFIVRGGAPLTGGEIDPHGDHRLAMSLAVAGLGADDPVTVRGAAIIHESFPQFAPILKALGAQIQIVDRSEV